jgi:hypothetical protein
LGTSADTKKDCSEVIKYRPNIVQQRASRQNYTKPIPKRNAEIISPSAMLLRVDMLPGKLKIVVRDFQARI